MSLQVRVSGPGVELTRRLEAGEPALIVGRDSDCAFCLPDPERNVSRRHLSVWNEGEQLHFHVLSVVNGVLTRSGELPPGARGVLAPGEELALSAFRLQVSQAAEAVAADPHDEQDPWAQLQREAERLPHDAEPTAPAPKAEDDPFGDWGFHSTFGPGAPGGTLRADALVPASDLRPFYAGLGLAPEAQPALTVGELEAIGRVTRIAVEGLLQAAEAAARTRQEARAENTTTTRRELNPLRMDTPLPTRLEYLFGGAPAAVGFMPPAEAVAQVVTDLAAHERAMAQAVQEALQGVLADFDPEAIKKRLLGGGGRLFESARAWEAFARDYAERSAAQPPWVQQILDRHFARAYARALLRAKRNTVGGPDG